MKALNMFISKDKSNLLALIIFGVVLVLYTPLFFYLSGKPGDETRVSCPYLAQDLEFPGHLKEKIHYESPLRLLFFKGVMPREERDELLNLSADPGWREAVEICFLSSRYQFSPLGADDREFAILADNLIRFKVFTLSGEPPLYPHSYRTPGYPLFLALFKLGSDSFVFVPLIQIILNAFTAVLIFKIGKGFLGDAPAFAASLIFALEPTSIRCALGVGSECLFVFLLTLSFYVLFYLEREGGRFKFLAGLILGFAVLTRPLGMFLPILFVLGFYFLKGMKLSQHRSTSLAVALFLLGYIVVLAPWMIRNKLTFGVWNLSSAGACNFFSRNIPEFLSFKYNLDLQSTQEIMLKDSGIPNLDRELRDLRNYRSEMTACLRVIKEDPAGFAKFYLVRTVPFFFTSSIQSAAYNWLGPLEYPKIFEYKGKGFMRLLHEREFSPFFRLFFSRLKSEPAVTIEKFGWFVVFILSLSAVFLSKDKKTLVLFWLIILHFALLVGPHSLNDARYRLPAEPFLFLLAVAGSLEIKKLLFRYLNPDSPGEIA